MELGIRPECVGCDAYKELADLLASRGRSVEDITALVQSAARLVVMPAIGQDLAAIDEVVGKITSAESQLGALDSCEREMEFVNMIMACQDGLQADGRCGGAA